MAVATYIQLQDLFYNVTRAVTGLGAQFVRMNYAPDGQPGWEIGQNLAVVDVSVVDDPYDKQRDVVYINSDPAASEEHIKYTRVLQVTWAIYGPLSFDLADVVRNGMLLNATKTLLAVQEVYPIPGIASPIKVPYLFNGQWWMRNDVTARFNNTIRRSGTTPYFAGVDVSISDAGGPERVIVLP